jgi:hypothetical protein
MIRVKCADDNGHPSEEIRLFNLFEDGDKEPDAG